MLGSKEEAKLKVDVASQEVVCVDVVVWERKFTQSFSVFWRAWRSRGSRVLGHFLTLFNFDLLSLTKFFEAFSVNPASLPHLFESLLPSSLKKHDAFYESLKKSFWKLFWKVLESSDEDLAFQKSLLEASLTTFFEKCLKKVCDNLVQSLSEKLVRKLWVRFQ